jgi:hypothetical protein
MVRSSVHRSKYWLSVGVPARTGCAHTTALLL